MTDLDLSAPNRVYWQYRDKPKINAIVKIYQDIAASLADDINRVRRLYEINVNEGAQLDLIGEVLNMPRPLVEKNGESSLMVDKFYRMLLRAKAVTGVATTTIDNYADVVEQIVNSKITVVDNLDMSFSIVFEEGLTDDERETILAYNIIPQPLGVEFEGLSESPSLTLFGRQQFNTLDQFTSRFF